MSVRRPSPPRQFPPALPPLVPILLPLIVAAILINLIFARVFPPGDVSRVGPSGRFTDITAAAGITFTHRHGSGASPVSLGGGVAVFDANQDGWLDLFLVNGAPWPWADNAWQAPGSSALYLNDGTGRFTDVTAAAGLDAVMNGMAAVTGDYDNDGDADLFVTCIGADHLWRNEGNGTFTDVSAEAGVAGAANDWSTGALWLDYDGDGHLDLIVGHYLRWSAEFGLGATINFARVGRSYGTPVGYLNRFPTVYRNTGDGRFVAVRDHAGLQPTDPFTGFPREKVLALTPLDANQDGHLDILFSFHTGEDTLFLNQADGSFAPWIAPERQRREGLAAGLAAAGSLPLAPVNRADDLFPMLQSLHPDLPARSEGATLDLFSKMGLVALDYDLDGHRDIFTAHGQAEPDLARIENDEPFASAPQLYWKSGDTWSPATGGPVITTPLIARGQAVGDFDGDGDLDLVLAQNQGPARIFRNDLRTGQPWLRIILQATRSHASAAGARIELHTPRHITVRTYGPQLGYLAQSDPALTFGLGEDTRLRRLVIQWPSGQRQEVKGLAINRSHTLVEP